MAARGQSQIQEFVDIVRRRIGHVVMPTAIALAIGNAVATLLPRSYEVSTQIELRETNMPVGGEGMVARGIQRDVRSATYHIKSSERVRRVIEKLEWQDFTSLTPTFQFEYLKRILKNIKVDVKIARGVGSSFIVIRYSDSDAERAEQFANRLRDAYTTEVVERFRNDARNVADNYQNQLLIAEQTYREKEKAAAELRRKHGLSATQRAAGEGLRAENPVYVRLTQSREQLGKVEVELSAAAAALGELRTQHAQAPREVPQETLTGGIGYENELMRIEAEIQQHHDRKAGLKHAHSIYKAAEEEIAKLEARRTELIEQASGPTSDVELVLNPRREQLAGQIQDRELLIKQLEATRDQLSKNIDDLAQQHAMLAEIYRDVRQLDNEVGLARKNLNDISSRYEKNRSLVEIINQPHANPFIVTDEALAPRTHTSPNEVLILTAAGMLGLALGLGLAILAEFGHNGYRGVTDITRAMSLPVLGVINAIVTREELRKRAFRRGMVASSTVILVVAIVWVTWAYENSPRLLGSELTRLIDDLRSQFR